MRVCGTFLFGDGEIMAQYDGAVRIGTNIDTKGIVSGEKEIEKHLNLLKIDVEEYSKSLRELESQGKFLGDEDYDKVYVAWKNAADAVKAYRAELDKQTESGQENIALKEARELERKEAIQRRIEEQAERNLQKENARIQKEIKNEAKLAEKEAARQAKEESRINALLAKEEAKRAKEIAAIQAQEREEQRLALIRENSVVGNQKIVEFINRIKQLEQEIADLKKAGITEGYEDYDNRVKELSALKQEVTEYSGKVEEAKKSYARLGQAAQKAFSVAQPSIKKAVDGIKKFGTFVKSAFSRLIKSTKRSDRQLGSFASRLKSLALSALIFNQISKAFNSMFSAIREGFGNLYKDVEGFRDSVDGLRASSLTLKNSFAAAFRPLVEVAIPYIQRTVDAISGLLNVMAQFTAAITGQKTYTKAVKQTTAALEEENEAQNNQLGSLDKLNNLSSAGKAGDSGSSGQMFEEAPITTGISSAADNVKRILESILGVFKKAWDQNGKRVADAAKKAFEDLLDVIKNVGQTLQDVFTGEIGLEWVESLLGLFESILGVINSISTAFSTAWDSGAGGENVSALFGMLTEINDLLKSIKESFGRAFSGDVGTEIFENVLGIFTGIYNTIGNIATGIQTAWDTAGLGDSIWNGILEIANTISGTIHDITDSTAEWGDSLDFTPLLESIDTLLQELQPLTENIGEGLEWFWNNVLLPIAGWTIQDAVPTFLDMLSVAVGTLNTIIDVIKPSFEWFWRNLLEPLGKWAGEAVISAMEEIAGLLEKIGGWISEHKGEISEFITIIGLLAAGFVGVQGAIKLATGVLPSLVKNIKKVIAILTGPLGLVLALAALVTATGHGEEMIESLQEILGGLLDFVVGVFTLDWERAWNGIVSIFEGIGKGIATVLDSILDGITWVLEKIGILNKTEIKPKQAGLAISGGTGIGNLVYPKEVKIPGYATGQVIPRSMRQHLAILGDNNQETEVVSPLSTIKQALREEAVSLGLTGGAGGTQELTIHIPVQINGRTLLDIMKQLDLEEYRRTGRSTFQV